MQLLPMRTLRLTGRSEISAEMVNGFLKDCFLGPKVLGNHPNVPLNLSSASTSMISFPIQGRLQGS